MTLSKLPDRHLVSQSQKNEIPHDNLNCRSHVFQGLNFLEICELQSFASPAIEAYVFYNTFITPTKETYVFYDLFASPTIETYVCYNTSAFPTIETYVCLRPFRSSDDRDLRILRHFRSSANRGLCILHHVNIFYFVTLSKLLESLLAAQR